jgi:hypothetical protein
MTRMNDPVWGFVMLRYSEASSHKRKGLTDLC